ncbi:hypothetical protein WICMUC_003750 [Wickerhamomyces mucosus]|uniref:SH3 domain-containing protein n=1 Tax=Wickerhamomyces mucosus TaxID=1378264 RepID=A0A9P8PKL8_9ASCO|nr:hypothetical protein WICMUC_003750 [Wickerhamomyces mucosus]
MTTITTLESSTTITSLVQITETAIVKGVLDISIELDSLSTKDRGSGITFDNKAVSSEPSTISTLFSTSTSTSKIASSTSSTTISSNNTSTTATSLFGSTFLENSSSTNTSNIGLIVGLPVAIVGSILVVVGLVYYYKQRRKNASKLDQSSKQAYHEKLNYKTSPIRDRNSPYIKTTFQIKPPNQYLTRNMTGATDSMDTLSNQPNNHSELSLENLPKPNPRWSLNSPLSRWFAKPGSMNSIVSSRASLSTGQFSPILTLKEFKLKRSQKSENIITKQTPVVPRYPEISYKGSYSSLSSAELDKLKSHSRESSEGTIVQQELTTGAPPKPPKLQTIPNSKKSYKPLPPIKNIYKNGNLKSSASSSLEGLETKVYERMIPTTPRIDISKYTNPSIYKVVKSYEKNLSDELDIQKGDYLKILARHTDGWCLVEKVDSLGDIIVKSSNEYLNEGRGVVPEVCLQEYIRF